MINTVLATCGMLSQKGKGGRGKKEREKKEKIKKKMNTGFERGRQVCVSTVLYVLYGRTWFTAVPGIPGLSGLPGLSSRYVGNNPRVAGSGGNPWGWTDCPDRKQLLRLAEDNVGSQP